MRHKLFVVTFLFATFMGVSSYAQGLVNSTESGYRDELDRIKSLPDADKIAPQIKQTEEWIDQAAAANQDGDRDEVKRLYQRVRFSLDMLKSFVGVEELENTAAEQKKLVETLGKQVDQMKENVAKLEAEQAKLEQELALLKQKGNSK